jgi:hypothetical protein
MCNAAFRVTPGKQKGGSLTPNTNWGDDGSSQNPACITQGIRAPSGDPPRDPEVLRIRFRSDLIHSSFFTRLGLLQVIQTKKYYQCAPSFYVDWMS